jgi:beta-phosphoglucomutase-like phosphatase (HAD superfamily)
VRRSSTSEDSLFGIAAARAAGMRCVAAHLTTEVSGIEFGTVVDVLGPELVTGS